MTLLEDETQRLLADDTQPRGCNDPVRFNIFCGLPAMKRTIIAQLTHHGCYYDPTAARAIVLDFPYGFALHTLATGNCRVCEWLVVTWSLCPEYWADLWDYHPSVLIAGASLAGDVVASIVGTLHRTSYRLTPGSTSRLSTDERQILRLLAHGHTNQQIARSIGMPAQKVKDMLTLIFQKLGLQNRYAALLYYWNIWAPEER